MSGGKGGSSTSSVQIPEYIEKAAQQNLNKAEKISQIGFVPQYGPSVAAFTPTQNAAFDNIANSASAFGMATPGAGTSANYGGMGQPTDFGGGVMGYSAKPLYDNMVNQFAADRPGQYNYINSFFIDPYTGQAGSNVTNTNYNDYSTATDMANAQMANDLAIAQANAAGSALSQPEYNTYVTTIQEAINDTNYDPSIDVLTPEQQIMIQNNPAAQEAQDTIYMNQLGNANNTLGDALTTLTGGEPSFDDPSGSGSYGGSLVTGQLSTDLTGIPGLGGEIIDSIYQAVDFEGATNAQGENFAEAAGSTQNADGSYNIDSWFTDTSATPTIDTSSFETDYSNTDANAQAAPMPMNYGDDTFADAVLAAGDDVSDFLAPTGGNDDGGTIGQISPGGQDAGDGFEWVDNGGYLTRTWVGTDDDDDTTTTTTNTSSNNSSSNNDGGNDGGNSGGTSSSGGCVVATHAVNAGAFTPSMKREAVVWCMHNLHDKWWGEAIRRGYRHLGRKAIEQGKAHEHYQEFRNYIDFASGKKRTLKGALHFAARSAQFFVVGLFKGDA